MSASIVLDNAVLGALAGGRSTAKETVRAAMTAAVRLQRDVVVRVIVLAEMYRARRHDQTGDPGHLDALNAPNRHVTVIDIAI